MYKSSRILIDFDITSSGLLGSKDQCFIDHVFEKSSLFVTPMFENYTILLNITQNLVQIFDHSIASM